MNVFHDDRNTFRKVIKYHKTETILLAENGESKLDATVNGTTLRKIKKHHYLNVLVFCSPHSSGMQNHAHQELLQVHRHSLVIDNAIIRPTNPCHISYK
jgi:hypothetical protein